MSSTRQQTEKVDLNEVLTEINHTSQRVFKDKNGRPFTEVPLTRLRRWLVAVEKARKDAEGHEALANMYEHAKSETLKLVEAAENKDREVAELTKRVEAAEKLAKQNKQGAAARLSELQSRNKSLQAQIDDLAESKAATQKALLATQEALEGVEAKFDADIAAKLSKELNGFKSDMLDANNEIAKLRNEKTETSRALDTLQKELAGYQHAADAAKAELATFKRKLAASNAGNHELFSKDDLNKSDLRAYFGSKAYEKLEQVMAIEPFDVRGRLQRLQGFFTVYARSGGHKIKAFLSVLKSAIELMKENAHTWAAILAPWVNSLLKDIVSYDLRAASHYRVDLEARIKAVKALPADATSAQKRAAAQNKKEPSWAEIAAGRRERASSLLSRMKARAQHRWAALRSLVSRNANRLGQWCSGKFATLKKKSQNLGSSLRHRLATVRHLFPWASGGGRKTTTIEEVAEDPIVIFDNESPD